jgi:pSer/pThr/pTyr-binding forkhead associated (FHA) protein
MSPKILVINPDQCMEVSFDQQITIGRDVFNSLSLQDPELSRSHAIIFEQDREVIIKDLKSRNGVYVNGDKISETTLLPGHEIILGGTVLIYDPPETLDLGAALSKRGRYLVEKRASKPTGPGLPEPVTIFTTEELDKAVEQLFNKPDGTTFFTLDNAIALLQAIKDMDDAPSASLLFNCALKRALAIVGGHRGVIMETDSDKKLLKVRSIVSRDNSETILIGQPILKIVLGAEKALYCPNLLRDPRFEQVAAKSAQPVHSFVAAPIRNGEDLFGFIYLDSEDSAVSYDYTALRSLHFISSHLGSLLRPRLTHFHKHISSQTPAA